MKKIFGRTKYRLLNQALKLLKESGTYPIDLLLQDLQPFQDHQPEELQIKQFTFKQILKDAPFCKVAENMVDFDETGATLPKELYKLEIKTPDKKPVLHGLLKVYKRLKSLDKTTLTLDQFELMIRISDDFGVNKARKIYRIA